MSYQIDYDPQQGVIFITVENLLNMARLTEIARQVAATSEAQQCLRILYDMSRAEIDVSMVDIYNSPQKMDEAHISRRTRRALVTPPGFDKGMFLETVTRNRGHNLRVFTDYDVAKEWLLQV